MVATVVTLLLFLAVGLLILWASSLLLSVLGGAQLVTTPAAVWPHIKTLANLQPNQQFTELGSGLGYVSGFMARSTQAIVVGIDLAPLWVWLARILQRGSGAYFLVGNVYTTDLAKKDVVYCYLLPPMLLKLESKFAEQLQPGSRVITYGFPLPNRQATHTIDRTKAHGPLFLYRF